MRIAAPLIADAPTRLKTKVCRRKAETLHATRRLTPPPVITGVEAKLDVTVEPTA